MGTQGVKIGIIGNGVVGGALRTWFERTGVDVRAFDPPQGLTDETAIDRADIVYVCVPTPYAPGAGFDDGYLLDGVRRIKGEKLVVIKSTVRPGTTDRMQQMFPRHRFMFNPEFLREATPVDDMCSPDRQIVGCTEQSIHEADLLLELLPEAPITSICAAREAEMTKYVANSFLALKVSYFNEVYDLCQRMGIEYDVVRDLVVADKRIGPSHSDVFDCGYRGYSGKCLPKDSKALIELAKSESVSMLVLQAADAVNGELIGRQRTAAALRGIAAADVEVAEVPDAAPERRAA